MKPELILGIWGAVTGSIACFHNLRQWRHDRANIKIDASMKVISDERGLRTSIVISGVNRGRRIAKIKSISVMLEKGHFPVPAHLTGEAREQFIRTMQGAETSGVTHSSTLTYAHRVDLDPDDGSFEWELPVKDNVRLMRKKKRKNIWGKGFLELTSGKKLWFRFIIISDEHLEQLMNPPRQ